MKRKLYLPKRPKKPAIYQHIPINWWSAYYRDRDLSPFAEPKPIPEYDSVTIDGLRWYVSENTAGHHAMSMTERVQAIEFAHQLPKGWELPKEFVKRIDTYNNKELASIVKDCLRILQYLKIWLDEKLTGKSLHYYVYIACAGQHRLAFIEDILSRLLTSLQYHKPSLAETTKEIKSLYEEAGKWAQKTDEFYNLLRGREYYNEDNYVASDVRYRLLKLHGKIYQVLSLTYAELDKTAGDTDDNYMSSAEALWLATQCDRRLSQTKLSRKQYHDIRYRPRLDKKGKPHRLHIHCGDIFRLIKTLPKNKADIADYSGVLDGPQFAGFVETIEGIVRRKDAIKQEGLEKRKKSNPRPEGGYKKLHDKIYGSGNSNSYPDTDNFGIDD